MIAVLCRVTKGAMGCERTCTIKTADGKDVSVWEQAVRIWHKDWTPVMDGELQKQGEEEECYLDVSLCGQEGRMVAIGTWDDRDPVTLNVDRSQVVGRPRDRPERLMSLRRKSWLNQADFM